MSEVGNLEETPGLCLGCEGSLPAPFLDLGRMPLANAYLKPGRICQVEQTFRLAVSYCSECNLVQLTDVVPPEQLFAEYLYFSSYSDSFLVHARRMADSLSERFGLDVHSRVLEIGSNDGYLLQYFRQRGVRVLGVEPARNIAGEAERRGIPTLNRFFAAESVPQILEGFGPADLIIGNNILAHVPRINDFLGAVSKCLHPAGAVVFEFPYLGTLLEKTEFDTIYHEHVFYYSVTALSMLARRAALEIFDVRPQPVHGGSLRVLLQHPGARPAAPTLVDMLADERAAGLTAGKCYSDFGRKVNTLKNELLELMRGLKASGKRLAAYGAPAKGNTLLNYCGIGRDLLDFAVDRSPHKQGLLLPGSRLPIRAPAALLAEQPDYTLILPWNIADEIVHQQQLYLRRGGRFIIPIPQPRVIEPGYAAR